MTYGMEVLFRLNSRFWSTCISLREMRGREAAESLWVWSSLALRRAPSESLGLTFLRMSRLKSIPLWFVLIMLGFWNEFEILLFLTCNFRRLEKVLIFVCFFLYISHGESFNERKAWRECNYLPPWKAFFSYLM